jgi:hypothetical protein
MIKRRIHNQLVESLNESFPLNAGTIAIGLCEMGWMLQAVK